MMVSDPSVFMLHNYSQTGLSEIPNGLHTGMNGGYQVVNLAVLAGGNPILLLAYDMRFHGTKTHSHNGHPIKHTEHSYRDTYARQFKTMLPQLGKMGVKVINCTPGSAIECFPFSTIECELS